MKFKKDSRDLLIGVTLGDGYLDKSGGCYIKHCVAQKDFLEWKVKLLTEHGYKCSEPSEIDNSGYAGCSARVHGTRWGKLLRKIVYGSGKKDIYNRKLLNRLNPLHLAIWYMDDGGISSKKRGGVIHANELFINTHTTRENNQVVIDYFKEVWGISFTQVKNKGHYRLRCGTKQARKFLDIVREYVSQVPSMAHKLQVKDRHPFVKWT